MTSSRSFNTALSIALKRKGLHLFRAIAFRTGATHQRPSQSAAADSHCLVDRRCRRECLSIATSTARLFPDCVTRITSSSITARQYGKWKQTAHYATGIVPEASRTLTLHMQTVSPEASFRTISGLASIVLDPPFSTLPPGGMHPRDLSPGPRLSVNGSSLAVHHTALWKIPFLYHEVDANKSHARTLSGTCHAF